MPAGTDGQAHLFFVGNELCQFLAVSTTGCIAVQSPENPVRLFHWYFRCKGMEHITVPPAKWLVIWSCRAPWNPEPCGEITRLIVNDCELTGLDVRTLTRLTHLRCAKNLIERLDCAGMRSLQALDCSGNELTDLNLDGCVRLEGLCVGGNRYLHTSVSELLAYARGEPTIFRRQHQMATSLFDL